uniref:Uncharacterized protein n=1 Tax=viral metagenome TaxID=1070528 RepID=A0A6C0DVV9_9ZZZZ
MNKHIIINNIKNYKNYIESYDSSYNSNNKQEQKKSYIELTEKSINSNANMGFNILDYYDNYDKQLASINNIYKQLVYENQDNSYNQVIYEKQYFLQALKIKHTSYKQQDKKKTYDDYNNFITLENIIEKLVSSSMMCYYCNNKTLILFKNAREQTQWTLDRLNNYDEHSNINTIICCLKCNLQRRRKNSAKFKFSKQLENKLILLKKIE